MPVALLQLAAKLALCGSVKLVVMLPLNQATAKLSKKNTLKVLRKSLQCLVVELAPAADVLCAVRAMKRHVEPLHLQCVVGLGDISLGEKLCDMKHFFKMMEVVQRARK